MSTTYAAIKTYVEGQQWDDQLQQNVQYKQRDDAKPRVYAAGDELDELARQRMTMFPGETYRQAFKQVLADNPELRAAYASIK